MNKIFSVPSTTFKKLSRRVWLQLLVFVDSYFFKMPASKDSWKREVSMPNPICSHVLKGSIYVGRNQAERGL